MRQYRNTKTKVEERDEWRTPKWLFRWLDEQYHFDVDLAANDANHLCVSFFTKEHSALDFTWLSYTTGFCNPPYSNIEPFYRKAVEQARLGFTSVFIVPTPNADMRDLLVMESASQIIYIVGRVNFLRPDGSECTGNMRGTCVIVFSPNPTGDAPLLSWRRRDTLMGTYSGGSL